MPQPILVVDDELDQRSVTRDILELFGYEVQTVSNGQEALEVLLTSVPPGIIFLDIAMPVMSGQEFLSALHSGAYPQLTHIPVIIVSAVSDFV